MAVEIVHLTFFKMAAICHLEFFKFDFFVLTAAKIWRTNMSHHAKFCQNRPNGFWNITTFWFSRLLLSAFLDFKIFNILVAIKHTHLLPLPATP